jgi:hypothetical protein
MIGGGEVFNNLNAEIARHRVKKGDIAKLIGKTLATFSLKLAGKTPFTYEEACLIHETYFPECDFKVLFQRESKVS